MVSFLISVYSFDLYASLLASLDLIGTFALRLMSFLCIFLSPENTSYIYGESGFLKLQSCLYLKSSQSETAIASVLHVAFEPRYSIFYKISFASSDDSDEPAHMQSDQSCHCRLEATLCHWLRNECPAKTLIRLCGCAGWSESSLGPHAIL